MTNSLSLFSCHKPPFFVRVTLQPQGNRINSKQLSIELSSRNLGKLFQADPHEIHGLRDVIEWLANWFCERFNKRPSECHQALQQLHALVNPQAIDLYRSQNQDGFTYAQALAPFRRIYELLPDEDMKQTFLESVQLYVSAKNEETIRFRGCPFAIKLQPGQQRPEGLVQIKVSDADVYPRYYSFPRFQAGAIPAVLMWHLRNNRIEAAQVALECCVPEDLFKPPPGFDKTPLHCALDSCPNFAEKILKRMLLAWGDLRLQGPELLQAICADRTDLALKILDLCSLQALQATNLIGESALMKAITAGNLSMAYLLIDRILQLSEQAGTQPIFTAITAQGNYTELHYAVSYGYWGLAKTLIVYSSLKALTAVTERGTSALMDVIIAGEPDVAHALMCRILELRDKESTEPIFTVITLEGNYTELFEALLAGDCWDLVEELIAHSSLKVLMVVTERGESALMKAITAGKPDVARAVLDRILQLSAQAGTQPVFTARVLSRNCTELFEALHQGYYELAEDVIKHSSLEALTAVSNGGESALMKAMRRVKPDLAKLIVDRILELNKQAGTQPMFTAKVRDWGYTELSSALGIWDFKLTKTIAMYSSLDVLAATDMFNQSLSIQAIRAGQVELAQVIVTRIRELNPQATFTLAPRQEASTGRWRISPLTAAQLVPRSAQR